jgi:hypothetical protein
VVQYLTRQSSEALEQHAEDLLDALEGEGYLEIVSGEKRESWSGSRTKL